MKQVAIKLDRIPLDESKQPLDDVGNFSFKHALKETIVASLNECSAI
jgi:hypothetical protein